MALSEEKQTLFRQVRRKLGGSTRKVELTDEDLCDLLDIAIGDYAERVQNFIIKNNWANLYGKNLSNLDIAFALSVRTMDMAQDYSYYFSKQVGLQQRGPWELKKDFVELEQGRQVYTIPAGREINKVMWITPPTTDQALFGAYGGLQMNLGNGNIAQMGVNSAVAFGGVGSPYGLGAGLWCLPAYDVALMATDMKYKNSLIKGELTYKVTAGPDGTRLLHLANVPGSKFTFGGGGNGYFPLRGCVCWYTYYDVSNGDADECRKKNPDVLLTPDQVPLEKMDYELLNDAAKSTVRRLLIAEAAETLGFTRGKFSGSINMLANPLQMDYQMLLSFGQREKENVMRELDERLQGMSPEETLKRQAEMTQSIQQIKKGVPLGIYVK